MNSQATVAFKRKLARDFEPIDQERALLVAMLRADANLLQSYLEAGHGVISRVLYKDTLTSCRRRLDALAILELTAKEVSAKKGA